MNQKEAVKVLEEGLETFANSLAEILALAERFCPQVLESERAKIARAKALLCGSDMQVAGDCHKASQGAGNGLAGNVVLIGSPVVLELERALSIMEHACVLQREQIGMLNDEIKKLERDNKILHNANERLLNATLKVSVQIG